MLYLKVCQPARLAVILCALAAAVAAQAAEVGCSTSAVHMRIACEFDVRADALEAKALCLDNPVLDDACLEAADTETEEGFDECNDVLEARLSLCADVDDAGHEVEFGEAFAANFVDPREIGASVEPNPYWPLVAGNTWVYEGTFLDDDGEEITEVITVTVMDKTKLIEGVNCVVVNDIVEEDGQVIEDTSDWYAQDVDGNVWYCGEIAENFEYFDGDEPEERELVDIDGSWKSGRDGAEAGILLPADPQVGDVIRQEVLLGDAEDAIEILSVTATETTPGASCNETCLQTRDFTPLEPDAQENKFYAPGIGQILEVDPETGDRVELIQFSGAGS